MNVLVTSARNIIGYTVVTSLGRRGIPVFTADFFRYSASFYSKYSCGHDIYPDPYVNQTEFMDSLCKIIEERRVDVLMPITDETFLIAENIEKLPNYVKVVSPTFEQISKVHDKYNLKLLAKKLNIEYPRTAIPEADEDLDNIAEEFGFPVVLKPRKGGGAWGIRYVKNRDSLRKIFHESLRELEVSSLMIQEYIKGHVICTGMLFNRGTLKAKISYSQLREFPVSGGTATLRISIKNKESETKLEKLLKHLNWHGPCEADFIISEKDGKVYLTDVNPRFWTSLYQSVACGVDFPYLTFRLAIGDDFDPVVDYKEGVQTRWFWGDLRVFASKFRNGRKAGILLDFIRSFQPKIKYDDFKLCDPLPFFIFPIFPLYQILRQGSLSPTRGGF
jgi:predicted ATP-grasp superfamily ATP-dependent carboligase